MRGQDHQDYIGRPCIKTQGTRKAKNRKMLAMHTVDESLKPDVFKEVEINKKKCTFQYKIM